MSIDHFIYVDKKKIYHRMICTEIIEQLRREGTAKWSGHSVYVMQGGIEYLNSYQDPAHAAADFEEWRRQPLENIRLTLDGVEQPGGRLSLTEEEIRKYFAEQEAQGNLDSFDTEEAE